MKNLIPFLFLVACGGTEVIIQSPSSQDVLDAGVPDAKVSAPAPDAKVSEPDAKSPFVQNQALPKEGCLDGEYAEVITPTSSNCASFPVGVAVDHAMKYSYSCQNFWNFNWWDGGPDSCMWRGQWAFVGFFNTAGYTAKLTMTHVCPPALSNQSCSFVADVKAVKK